MKKTLLSQTQLADLNFFHLILESYGWDDMEDSELKLDNGLDINPEGSRIFRKSYTVLKAEFHAPVNMITLKIGDCISNEEVKFHFFYDESPIKLLEWVVSVSEDLSTQTYPELLKQTHGCCDLILLQVSDSRII